MKGMIKGFKRYGILSDQLGALPQYDCFRRTPHNVATKVGLAKSECARVHNPPH